MGMTGRRRHRGEVIAKVLAGSWRADPPATAVSPDQLALVAPLLMATGAAGLAWRTAKLRVDLLPVAEQLRQAWLLEVGRERLRDELVAELAAAAEAKGIEVLIYKGWAAARYYPGPGLRPSGDIDVIVAAEDASGAHEIAARIPRIVLDVHSSPPPGLGTAPALLARADRVTIEGATVAVPALGDHVLMTAWHMFKHGAWRPVWLCDVAAMLEAALSLGVAPPADEPYDSYWAVAAGLAATMLGARTEPRVAPVWVRRTLGMVAVPRLRSVGRVVSHVCGAGGGGATGTAPEPACSRGGSRTSHRCPAPPNGALSVDRRSVGRRSTSSSEGHRR
ncbi:MAG: nucleotidyltransferase family protein [Solirubrobacterales bacterium]